MQRLLAGTSVDANTHANPDSTQTLPVGGVPLRTFPGRPASATKPVRSILIILMKFFGDQIIASALIRNLRTHSGVQIVVLGQKAHADFLISHGIADDFISPRERRGPKPRTIKFMSTRVRDFIGMLRKLRSQRFDMTIDLTDRKTSRFLVGLIAHFADCERPFHAMVSNDFRRS